VSFSSIGLVRLGFGLDLASGVSVVLVRPMHILVIIVALPSVPGRQATGVPVTRKFSCRQ